MNPDSTTPEEGEPPGQDESGRTDGDRPSHTGPLARAGHKDIPLRARPSESWAEELRRVARLAFPMIVVQCALIAMRSVDAIMCGNISKEALDGVGLGNSFAFLLSAFVLGVLGTFDAIVSQALGADDERGVRLGIQRGLILAAALSVPVMALWWWSEPLLRLCRQNEEVIPLASDYMRAIVPSAFPGFAWAILRIGLQAQHRNLEIIVVALLANGLNVVLDLAWIHGHFGFEPLGVTGCGYATSVCSWMMPLGLLALGWRRLGPHLTSSWRDAPRLLPIWRVLKLGVPVGVQVALEGSAFVVVMLMMGYLGKTELAAHVVAISLASFSFMMPLGVSMAAAVRVGWYVGARDVVGARRAASTSLLLGAGIMAIWALAFLIFPEALTGLFTKDDAVLQLARGLMPLAALFQIFDGLQVVGGGILRGAGDTKVPMQVHLMGFWLAGIPFGFALTLWFDAGPHGLWWGLVTGLILVAGVFFRRIQRRFATSIERVSFDD